VPTLLVETLVEFSALQRLYDSLPSCSDTVVLQKRIAEAQTVLDYLRTRFTNLNEGFSAVAAEPAPRSAGSAPPIDVLRTRSELTEMDDSTLLRYGAVLKYICSAEAELLDLPLETSVALLRETRAEWLRRFGKSALAQSI
jgi:hypothetical protein